mmetsp:Transcript_105475/g.164443  ORF Transcript_105475/g.164443 Transcript_105475/m.164443 type:complete len:199 (+) Transcript_105475:474-1070(+)
MIAEDMTEAMIVVAIVVTMLKVRKERAKVKEGVVIAEAEVTTGVTITGATIAEEVVATTETIGAEEVEVVVVVVGMATAMMTAEEGAMTAGVVIVMTTDEVATGMMTAEAVTAMTIAEVVMIAEEVIVDMTEMTAKGKVARVAARGGKGKSCLAIGSAQSVAPMFLRRRIHVSSVAIGEIDEDRWESSGKFKGDASTR